MAILGDANQINSHSVLKNSWVPIIVKNLHFVGYVQKFGSFRRHLMDHQLQSITFWALWHYLQWHQSENLHSSSVHLKVKVWIVNGISRQFFIATHQCLLSFRLKCNAFSFLSLCHTFFMFHECKCFLMLPRRFSPNRIQCCRPTGRLINSCLHLEAVLKQNEFWLWLELGVRERWKPKKVTSFAAVEIFVFDYRSTATPNEGNFSGQC